MIGILFAVILESEFSEAVKGDAAQVACRDDAVGVDVVKEQGDAGAGDVVDFVSEHLGVSKVEAVEIITGQKVDAFNVDSSHTKTDSYLAVSAIINSLI